jgi:hypothetical protein
VRIVKRFCPYIYLILVFYEADCQIDKVSAGNRPNSAIFHIVYLVMNRRLLILVKYLYLLQHRIDFRQGFLFFEELDDLIDVKLTDFDALACDSAIEVHLVELAGLLPVLGPLI